MILDAPVIAKLFLGKPVCYSKTAIDLYFVGTKVTTTTPLGFIAGVCGVTSGSVLCTVSKEFDALGFPGNTLAQLSPLAPRVDLLGLPPDTKFYRYSPIDIDLLVVYGGLYKSYQWISTDSAAPIAQPTNGKRVIPDFPHVCPNPSCRAPAYLGFNVKAICSRNCSPNIFKKA